MNHLKATQGFFKAVLAPKCITRQSINNRQKMIIQVVAYRVNNYLNRQIQLGGLCAQKHTLTGHEQTQTVTVVVREMVA